MIFYQLRILIVLILEFVTKFTNHIVYFQLQSTVSKQFSLFMFIINSK